MENGNIRYGQSVYDEIINQFGKDIQDPSLLANFIRLRSKKLRSLVTDKNTLSEAYIKFMLDMGAVGLRPLSSDISQSIIPNIMHGRNILPGQVMKNIKDKIDAMSNEEVEKLYARYESRLGATMTKTLGQAILQLYARAAGHVLPIPPASQNLLYTDLENDPFVGHALTSVTCELYHKYGMYLAPITTALTTARYCEFKQTHTQVYNDDDGTRESNCSDNEKRRILKR